MSARPFTWTVEHGDVDAMVSGVYAAIADLSPREYARKVVELTPPAGVRVVSRSQLAAEYADVPALAKQIRTAPVPAGKMLCLVVGEEVQLTLCDPAKHPDELPARQGVHALLGRLA